MEESIIQNEEFHKVLSRDPIIAFVPLHGSKLKERGYNQVELLAEGLGKKLALQVQNVLVRTRQTKPQFGLKKKEREDNVSDAFAIRDKGQEIRDKTIFLVDDVLTTGSTLLECANILKRGGAKQVFGVTLAID